MDNIRKLGLLAVLATGHGCLAQSPPEPKYGYEVVSIRKSDPADRGNRIGPGPHGGMRTTNTTLMGLLSFSYDVRGYQIIDAPAWARSSGFDVSFTPDKPELLPRPGEADAKAMETIMDRQRQRLQAVLRDRFGLKLRVETRTLPVYELTVAKGRGKLRAPEEVGKGPGMQTNPALGELTGTGANMRMLVKALSDLLGRPIIDRTGITETFDLKLHWKPDSFAGGSNGPPGDAPRVETDGASIFTAVTEQLGLKLEPKKGPVAVYVVEKAERPSEN